jgi:hypothetical protein
MAVTATITVEARGRSAPATTSTRTGRSPVSGTYVTGGFASTSRPATPTWRTSAPHAKGSGRLLEWDAANQKLLVKAWATAGATVAASEITNGTDIGADTGGYRFFAIGQ